MFIDSLIFIYLIIRSCICQFIHLLFPLLTYKCTIICLSVHLFVHLFTHLFSINLFCSFSLLNDLFIQSLMHWFVIHLCLFINLFIYLCIHQFIYSIVHLFDSLFIQSLTHLFINCWFVHFFVHSLHHLFNNDQLFSFFPLTICCLMCSLTHTHWFICLFTYSFIY